MDMIYSRKRIRLPKLIYKNFNSYDPKKSKKMTKFVMIITIAIVTFTMAIRSITPVFETLCKDKAKSIATIICNEESTKIVNNYKYEDIITVEKNTNGKITMVKSNIVPINLIISDIAEKIQKRIDEVEQDKIGIKVGTFTGTKLLSGVGPTIPIKLSTVGNVQTDLRSEFKSEGINQTIHRIYLQIDCNVSILTPYNTVEESISNQFLIAENVIVGEIPEAYYNLQGIGKENLTDIIK